MLREGSLPPIYHVSHVTCHMSCVTCHMSHVSPGSWKNCNLPSSPGLGQDICTAEQSAEHYAAEHWAAELSPALEAGRIATSPSSPGRGPTPWTADSSTVSRTLGSRSTASSWEPGTSCAHSEGGLGSLILPAPSHVSCYTLADK